MIESVTAIQNDPDIQNHLLGFERRKSLVPVWDYLSNHYNQPCAATALLKAMSYHKDGIWQPRDSKIIAFDVQNLRMKISIVRESLLRSTRFAIYDIFRDGSYLLTEAKPEGAWVQLPYPNVTENDPLKPDLDFIHQAQVGKSWRLLKRLSTPEQIIFDTLYTKYTVNKHAPVLQDKLITTIFPNLYWFEIDSADRYVLHNHISRIRAKIKDAPTLAIKTIPCVGFRLTDKREKA